MKALVTEEAGFISSHLLRRLMAIGLLLSFGLAGGPVTIGKVGFGLYWMLLGVTCTTLGYSSIQIGVLARVMHGLRLLFVKRAHKLVTYDHGMITAAASAMVGMMLLATLVLRYLNYGLRLEALSYPAILGLLLIILGFQTFCFTLLTEMAQRVASKFRE
jgi:hypothetical protein